MIMKHKTFEKGDVIDNVIVDYCVINLETDTYSNYNTQLFVKGSLND